MKEEIKEITQNLLGNMGFSDIVVEVEETEEAIKVNVNALPENSGILIGYHGEGVDALQLIVNLIVNKDNQDWTRVSVNINDYRERREEAIRAMAERAASNAVLTGKEIVLNFLPSHERRIAHMFLSENDQVETHSEGYGKTRRLIISPKTA
ncbi:protein jag [Patescibacteria group bacterium]